YAGELRDYVRVLLPLWREAEEREDHFSLATYHGGAVSLVSLLWDQPDEGRQRIERGMARWSSDESDVRTMAAQLSHAEIELYEGDGAAAYRRIERGWRRWLAAPFARMGFVRARMLSLHGAAALAAARSGGLDRRLIRGAARDARGLRAIRRPWADALAQILDAGVALSTAG